MICYRDKTFCTFHKECKKGHSCDRALTEEVKEAAAKWWGSEDAPILSYTGTPECFEENESNE